MTGYRQTPPTVEQAVTLFWVSFWIGAVSAAWGYFQLQTGGWQTAIILSTLLTFLVKGGFCILLFDKTHAGRNWARILLAMGFALTALSLFSIIGTLIKSPVQPASLEIIRLVLWGYGLTLLFSEPGKNWFGKQEATEPS